MVSTLTLDENCLASSLTEGMCTSSADSTTELLGPPRPPAPPPSLSRLSDHEHTRTSLSRAVLLAAAG
jgi:hypothetical protein